jgi:hypothetical protein
LVIYLPNDVVAFHSGICGGGAANDFHGQAFFTGIFIGIFLNAQKPPAIVCSDPHFPDRGVHGAAGHFQRVFHIAGDLTGAPAVALDRAAIFPIGGLLDDADLDAWLVVLLQIGFYVKRFGGFAFLLNGFFFHGTVRSDDFLLDCDGFAAWRGRFLGDQPGGWRKEKQQKGAEQESVYRHKSIFEKGQPTSFKVACTA